MADALSDLVILRALALDLLADSTLLLSSGQRDFTQALIHAYWQQADAIRIIEDSFFILDQDDFIQLWASAVSKCPHLEPIFLSAQS